MISAVAFCPQAPVLVPDVARGAAAELDVLRAACRTAIGRLAAPGRQLVLLGGGERAAAHGPTSRGSFAGFGLDLEVALGSDEPGPTDLPPSLAVGAWLLRDALGPDCGAVGWTIAGGIAVDPPRDEVGLLVVGDGTARRSVRAPGYLDGRAAHYDDTIAAALAGGDPAALSALDPHLGAALLAAGVPAWRGVGELLAGTSWQAEVLYDDAPYGVGYLVASWTAHG